MNNDIESDALFNGLAYSFAISGFLLLIVAFIGGKNSNGKRIGFGVLGTILVAVAALALTGVFTWLPLGRGKGALCILFGPWAALIWGIVGIFRESGGGGDTRDVPPPTAQQWNQQNPGAQQWGAPGQPGQVPQQWGQQPPAQAPQQWGQQPPAAPGQQPPAQPGWGQQQPGQQQWGQQPGQPPQQWGQPGQAPGQQPPQGWQQYPPQG